MMKNFRNNRNNLSFPNNLNFLITNEIPSR